MHPSTAASKAPFTWPLALHPLRPDPGPRSFRELLGWARATMRGQITTGLVKENQPERIYKAPAETPGVSQALSHRVLADGDGASCRKNAAVDPAHPTCPSRSSEWVDVLCGHSSLCIHGKMKHPSLTIPHPLTPSPLPGGLIGGVGDSKTLPSPGALPRFSVKMEGPRAFRLAGKLPEALAVKLGELGSRGYREEEPRGGGETPTLPRPLGLPVIDAKETQKRAGPERLPALARSWQKRRSKTASVAKCQLGTAVPAST
ncbi:hypothetical protein MG293_004159 [Ovis ammon polii]|uniref:Uncharacterized protein n=1 Tax=Ovis ammon polii TaxID=230172 RepID=A0AAD4UMQ8_OVIAM|nr:hypothetical protein MG293_004159 [Ovis ammon polii]